MNNRRHRRLIARAGERQLWANEGPNGVDHELILGGVFIMASYNGLSSELLVQNAVKAHGGTGLRVLIGGLGLGYSVKAACMLGAAVRAADVIELDPVVIAWNRTWLRGVNGRYLDHPRVTVIEGDFLRYVRETDRRYDAICMDIDNGPMLLVNERNAAAYEADFFASIGRALAPGGVFSIWSCNEDDALRCRMRAMFDACAVQEVPEYYENKLLTSYLYSGRRREP